MAHETKHERFKRIANKRIPTLLDGIRKIGNLSTKTNYEYTDRDISKIFIAIEDSLSKCRGKFSEPKKEDEFQL